MKNRREQRHHRSGKEALPTVATASNPPLTSNAGTKKMPTSTKHQSATDTLIAQLREHVEQGRIFDARSTVHELQAIESKDPTSSITINTVRHLMDEVISQSDHVECLLHELHSDDDWTLAKQKSGVTVHYRREENSPIHTVRAATSYDNFTPKDFVRFCSLFVETELMHRWFPGGVMQPANLLSWHSKYSKVIQLKINIGIPMVSTRDAIVLGSGYHLPDRNAFLISTKTILEDTCRYCKIPKPDKGHVRMATDSIFYVEMVKSDVINFKMIGRDDLKLKYMPSSFLNHLSQGHMPFDLMKTIHRKIRNFEGTVWEKKIQERGAYYTEIEDKVYSQLEKWENQGGEGINSHIQIEEKSSSKESTANSRATRSIEVKQLKTKYFTGDEEPTQIFLADENGRKGRNRHHMALIAATLSALIALVASVLSFVSLPVTLHEFLETLRAETLLFAMIIMSFLLVFVIVISLRARIMNKEDCAIDHGKFLTPTNIGNRGYEESLRFVNSAEIITESAELNAPTAGSDDFLQLINSDPKTNAAPTGLDQSIQITNIDDIAEMTSSALSPHADPQQPNPTIRPPSMSRKKLKKARSTINIGLKRMKSIASLRDVVSSKRNASKEEAQDRKSVV